MAASTWGLTPAGGAGARAPDTTAERPKKVTIPPAAARAAHTGIVWIHGSAIAIWLLVTLLLGALYLAGKAVPPIVLLIGLAASLGHGAFLLTHVLLAGAARRRAERASA